ncbi:MAG: FAD:protein FMN transferase [Clostridia bacterium]|nr:FAD:protein FMN transferase [Clostridia bacterium]
MKYRFKYAALMMALVMLLPLLAGCGQNQPQPQPTATAQTINAEKTSQVGFFFDTVVTLTLYGAPEGLMQELMDACSRYERLLSKTVEDSDVYRINHAGGEPVQVDPETWQIISRAKNISAETEGAFSITIAPLTEQWHFTTGEAIVPPDEVLQPLLPLVDDSAIELGENNTVRLPKGMQIDLGGIAKGYIADSIAALCRGRIVGGTLNFGGNIYAVGEKPDGSPFRIGVTDPQDKSGSPIAIIEMKDKTTVTSGTYERFFLLNGVTYHHILNPKTGSSAVTDLTSCTIVGDSSMDADAYATACIVFGREKAMAFLEQHHLDGLLIDGDNKIYPTPGFADKYPLTILK